MGARATSAGVCTAFLEALEPRLLLDGLAVVSVSPAGDAAKPFELLDIRFSVPVQDGTFTLDDIVAAGPGGGAISPVDLLKQADDFYRLDLTGLTGSGSGRFTLDVGPHVQSAGGGEMDQNGNGAGGEADDAWLGTLVAGGGTIADGNPEQDGRDLIIHGGTENVVGSHSFAGLSVMGGATLTLGGGSVLTATGAVLVTGSSTILCQGSNTTVPVDAAWAGHGVTIQGGEVTVEAGSKISADGQGYVGGEAGSGRPVGSGPGGGGATSSGGAGGSHGGAGGAANGGATGGASYDSSAAPTEPGSGGGDNSDNSPAGSGGAGGGAIRLIVDGTLTVDGAISADGAAGVGGEQGGGAGGALWITADSVGGTGTISANGGAGQTNGAGGGGGRVAVEYADALSLATSNVTAAGAAGYHAGSAGTVVFRDLSPAGPYVTAVAPPAQTNDAGITTITLELSEAVVGGGARDAATYTLLHLGADRAVGGGDDTAVAVTPAYTDGEIQITLTTAAPLAAGLYQLTVLGGTAAYLRDPDGNALDQNQDGAADDLVTTIDVDLAAPTVSGVVAGACLSFDGTNDFVYVGDEPELDLYDKLTFEAWIYPTDAGGDRPVIAKEFSGGQQAYWFGVYGGKLRLLLNDGRNGWALNVTAGTIVANKWQHVAATWDGTTWRMYIDGAEVGSGTFALRLTNSAMPLMIGRNSGYDTTRFAGMIADVRVWNVARGEADLQAAMRAQLSGGEAGLVGCWRLDEGAGGIVRDLSPGGNDGWLGMDLPGRSPAWTPFAVEAQRSVLRVTYSDAGGMDALAAATAGNYRLHASGGDGTFGDGNEYEAAGPSSVDFDAAAGVAALHFDAPLAD